MRLRERLETLDQAVLEQFEKLTQKANRELGWTKYDLKRIADGASAFSMGATGLYSILAGIFLRPVLSGTQLESQTSLWMATGALGLGLAYSSPKLLRIVDDFSEKVESELAHRGVTMTPSNSPCRPLYFMIPALFLGLGRYISTGTGIHFPDGTITSAPGFFQSMGLFCYGASWVSLFETCSKYLSDTTMTPPSIKKPFWKTLYQRAAAAIMPKPQPEKVPVSTVDYATLPEVST